MKRVYLGGNIVPYDKNNQLSTEDLDKGCCIYCGGTARKSCGSTRDTMYDNYYYCDCEASKVVSDLQDKAQPLRDKLHDIDWKIKLLRDDAKELLDIKSKARTLQKLLNNRKLDNSNLDEIINL